VAGDAHDHAAGGSDSLSIGVPPVLANGTDGVYDRVEYRYNRQGQVTQMKAPFSHRPKHRTRGWHR